MAKAPLTDCQDDIFCTMDDTNTSDACCTNLVVDGVTKGTPAKEQAAGWRQTRNSHVQLTEGQW